MVEEHGLSMHLLTFGWLPGVAVRLLLLLSASPQSQRLDPPQLPNPFLHPTKLKVSVTTCLSAVSEQTL